MGWGACAAVLVVVVLCVLGEGAQRHRPIHEIRVKWRLVDAARDTPAVYGGTGQGVGDKVFLLGGSNQTTGFSSTVHTYNIVRDEWGRLEEPSDMVAIPRAQGASALCGDRIYMFGGKEDASTASAQLSIYDTRTGVWSGGNEFHPSPEPMYGHSLVAIHHSHLPSSSSFHTPTRQELVRGVVSDKARMEMEAMARRHTGLWLELEQRTESRGDLGNCDLLLMGGKLDSWIGLTNDMMWKFNTVTRTWSAMRHIEGTAPSPRIHHVAVAVGPQVLLYGGDEGLMQPANSDDCWIFDAVGAEWRRCPMSGPRPPALVGSTGVVFGNVVYLFGGYDGARLRDDVFAYHMNEYRWLPVHSTTPPDWMLHPRAFHIAVAMPTDTIRALAGDGMGWGEEGAGEGEGRGGGGAGGGAHEWQQMVAEDGPRHVMVVAGGSGYYDDSPIFADTWVMEAEVVRGSAHHRHHSPQDPIQQQQQQEST